MPAEAERKNRWSSTLESLTTMAMLVASLVLIWAAVGRVKRTIPTAPEQPVPRELLELDGAALFGRSEAKVAIVQFSEFECPYCAAFWRDTMPALREKYLLTGKVLFAFRHFPLEQLHPAAFRAAVTAACSGRQGRFWEVHDALFADPKSRDPSTVDAVAEMRGVQVSALRECSQGDGAAQVRRDLAMGRTLGVSGTPTFFVGTIDQNRRMKVIRRVEGAQPFANFAGVLDRLLGDTAGSTTAAK